MITEARAFRCKPDVLFQEVSGEIVLLDLKSERYFGLNKTGARIWQGLSKGRSTEEIVSGLADEFEAAKPQLQDDVHELLQSLVEAGLIEPTD